MDTADDVDPWLVLPKTAKQEAAREPTSVYFKVLVKQEAPGGGRIRAVVVMRGSVGF
jgi:hypothetical protein